MIIRIYIFIFLTVITFSCQSDYSPKPRAYFRIDLPKKQYEKSPEILPYRFELPSKSLITNNRTASDELFWINIEYPQYKATVYLSYKKIDGNLQEYIDDSRGFVYKHTIKADAIMEEIFINEVKKVYGIKYTIKGDAASNTQFFITDSVKNFVRGALYFNVTPNKDSLAPVLSYINDDITHLIETFEWK